MNEVNWNEAPQWAEFYGVVGPHHRGTWYNGVNYTHIDSPDDMYDFGGLGYVFGDVICIQLRPVLTCDVNSTVEERGKNYGAFKDGADIMQQLKSVMRSTPNWENLTPSQREALEMIQHKIGRILNGDPNYTDNWHDIQGYAHLIEEELNGNVK